MKTPEQSFVTVVSGLPRSGTSMMMQMLDAGGLPVLTDQVRAADRENPKGYYELEAVKRTKADPSWVEDAVGKAVKVVYLLLSDLPADHQYRVVFMRRSIDEVVRSQQAMLAQRGEVGAGISDQQMASVFQRQLEKRDVWLAEQPHFKVLNLPYHEVIDAPQVQARRVSEFLGMSLDLAAMASAVDPALYRQRQ